MIGVAGIAAAAIAILAGSLGGTPAVLGVLGLLCFSVLAAVRPVYALCIGLALAPIDFFSIDIGQAVAVNPAESIFLLTAVIWVAQRLANGEPVMTATPLTLPLVVSVIAIAPGIALAETPIIVVKIMVMWTVFIFLFQLVVTEVGMTSVNQILAAICIAGAILGVIAIATSGPQEVSEFGRQASGRATATFVSPNRLGEYLALAIPCQVALLVRGSLPIRVIAGLSLALALAGLLLTLSRAAYLAVFGAAVLLLLWRPFRRLVAVFVAVVGLLMLIGANPVKGVVDTDVIIERVTSIRSMRQAPIHERLRSDGPPRSWRIIRCSASESSLTSRWTTG